MNQQYQALSIVLWQGVPFAVVKECIELYVGEDLDSVIMMKLSDGYHPSLGLRNIQLEIKFKKPLGNIGIIKMMSTLKKGLNFQLGVTFKD